MSKKNIVITGVSSGIGYSAAKVFTQRDCRVFGSVRSDSDAKRIGKALGENFIPVVFDVTDEDAVNAGAQNIAEKIGDTGLACLINNSGISVEGAFMHLSLSDYRKQFEVNVFGVIAVTKAFLPLLGAKTPCPHPPGKIINISSVSGQMSLPFMSPYCGSKHALEGISNCLRQELLIYGIDVIIVGPGPIKTRIWKKAEENNIPKETLESDWGPYARRFRDFFLREGKTGLEADRFAEKLYAIFTAKKPNTRYTFLSNKFFKWTIPRYVLSARAMDKMLKKMLKL